MILLGALGTASLITALVILMAAIAYTIYSFQNAVLVDDYDNPIEKSINTEA